MVEERFHVTVLNVYYVDVPYVKCDKTVTV